MSLKSVVRPWLRPLAQWAAVGIVPPQQAVVASLDGPGHSTDVTACHAVASLKPLSVAIALGDLDCAAGGTLVYRETDGGKELGRISLRQPSIRSVDHVRLGIFAVEGASHRCLSWPQRPWNAWLQSRAILKNRNPHNFQMSPRAVQQLMTFYICPRPVVLVSVSEPTHSNIFPMDLIGPSGDTCFTLALRNTSISVPTMIQSRRIAISGVGAGLKDVAYKLGEHHRHGFADWDSLPFTVGPSATFEIPVPANALWVRELGVQNSEQLGSHTFFVCRIVSERFLSPGPQLHHTAGFHQEYRSRKGRPFAAA